MTDFTITTGTASYRRVKRPADFESQEPALTLNFEMMPGADPEAVTARVMAMAKNAVERVFSTQTSPQTLNAGSPISGKRGKKDGDAPVVTPPSTADVRATEPTAANVLADLVAEKPATVPSPEDDLATLAGGTAEPEVKALTSEDVQHALMAASAHLRKEFGHINDIKKLLTTFGVAGWSMIPAEKYADFVDKIKGLLDLKKGS